MADWCPGSCASEISRLKKAPFPMSASRLERWSESDFNEWNAGGALEFFL
jgi:hypothetical protein